MLRGVGWVTPEYRKMLWGPLRGDGQTFQGGVLVSLWPPGFEKAESWPTMRVWAWPLVWKQVLLLAQPLKKVSQWHMTGFSLGVNDRAQRPVILFGALSFVLSALSFFQRPVIFRGPFGFFGLSSALLWAWSCRKRPIKAKGGAIFVHHIVIRIGHRRHLGFMMNINLCKLVRPVVFQD